MPYKVTLFALQHKGIGANFGMQATQQQFLALMSVSHVKRKQYAQAHD